MEINVLNKGISIKQRICVAGRFVLTSPTLIGSGNDEGVSDIVIHRDSFSGKPLLPGSTLAGALRHYLMDALPDHSDDIKMLFGDQDTDSHRSYLIVDDAYGYEAGMVIRDGVRIDSKTKTAEDKGKYDYELLSEGSHFDLYVELWVPDGGDKLIDLFAFALQGLGAGDIPFGVRKRRGFGYGEIKQWNVSHFDVGTVQGLIDWLDFDRDQLEPKDVSEKTISELLNRELLNGSGSVAKIKGKFTIDGALLIATSPPTGSENEPDLIQIRNSQNPIIPGSSLAGVLRAQAEKICNTLGKDQALVEKIFGSSPTRGDKNERLTASRLWVKESEIIGSRDLIQNRVKIDRFTGGAYPSALFSEQPVFGGTVEIDLKLEVPTDAEIGLMLLILKDLWSGFLTIGGTSSIGRGRLKGEELTVDYRSEKWTILNENDLLSISGSDPEKLEQFVSAFVAPAQEEE